MTAVWNTAQQQRERQAWASAPCSAPVARAPGHTSACPGRLPPSPSCDSPWLPGLTPFTLVPSVQGQAPGSHSSEGPGKVGHGGLGCTRLPPRNQ